MPPKAGQSCYAAKATRFFAGPGFTRANTPGYLMRKCREPSPASSTPVRPPPPAPFHHGAASTSLGRLSRLLRLVCEPLHHIPPASALLTATLALQPRIPFGAPRAAS